MKPPKQKKKVTTVREHLLHTLVSSKHPDGLTVRHQHARRLPGTYLGPDEIRSTFKSHDRKKLKLSTAGKIKDLKNPDAYDDFIAVWSDYFNKKLNVDPPLDPDVLKALLASESGFLRNPKNPSAFGIAQITKETLAIVQDPSGEARDFTFNKIRLKDLKDPSLAIPIAARWLSRKKVIAKSKLDREPNAEEIILEYKGLLRSKTKFKDKALTNFRKYYALLKSK